MVANEAGRSKEVDAYIATQPPEARRALEDLRSCIREAEPGVSEQMNYDMPPFALVPGGKRIQQIMIAGHAKHVGFSPALTPSTRLPTSLLCTASPRVPSSSLWTSPSPRRW